MQTKPFGPGFLVLLRHGGGSPWCLAFPVTENSLRTGLYPGWNVRSPRPRAVPEPQVRVGLDVTRRGGSVRTRVSLGPRRWRGVGTPST